ncbi:MAG: hypothetical protein IMW89_20455 [Ktedonobacteraceae bacterium]|nr:hypothetical protein [Ktedonobacteraceae bacterium]
MDNEIAGLDWSNDRIIPAFQALQHLDIYDIRGASSDTRLTVTTLAGIINRPQPLVYLITHGDDAFWLRQTLSAVPQTLSPAQGDEVLHTLLTAYRARIRGLIIYDPALIDTVNVATVLAGLRESIVVSPAQAQVLQETYKLPVLADLRVYGWRTRLQAYRWAQQILLPGCSRRLVAGLDPAITTGLRSFLVATRTFVYWLDSRKYLPEAGDGLLSERTVMQQILAAYPAGTPHLGWFIDESSGVNLTSLAAQPVLASDYFTNLEVWAAWQPSFSPPESVQEHMPAIENKIYLSFTISDGDNLQYCQHRLMHLWRDSLRGSLPIGWTLSPVLLQAAPAMAAYYRTTATANDELIAAPSGAGYIFPSHWPVEQVTPFLQRTGPLMQLLGMQTLEVLDTTFWQSSGLPFISDIRLTGMTFTDHDRQVRFAQGLMPYGLRGILSGAGIVWPHREKIGDIPLYHNLGLAGSVGTALALIRFAALTHPRRPLFLNVYILAWSLGPTDLKQVVQQLGGDYVVILPRTLLAMLAKTL